MVCIRPSIRGLGEFSDDSNHLLRTERHPSAVFAFLEEAAQGRIARQGFTKLEMVDCLWLTWPEGVRRDVKTIRSAVN